MRWLLAFALPLSLAAPAMARDGETFHCEITDVPGWPLAEVELDAKGVRTSSLVAWGIQRGDVMINAWWELAPAPNPFAPDHAWIAYSDPQARKKQPVHLEMRAGGTAGALLLMGEPEKADRYGFASLRFDWQAARRFAREVSAIDIAVIDAAGVVRARAVLTSADIEQGVRESETIRARMDAMVADYRNACASSRDRIVIVD
jgi:hypothetical protein